MRGFCGRAGAVRWAVGSSACVGAVARVRRFRPEKGLFLTQEYTGSRGLEPLSERVASLATSLAPILGNR